MATTEYRTADLRPIEEGCWYWNNNLDLVQVTSIAALVDNGVAWHETTRGLSDGSRLAVTHPFTRQSSAKAAEEATRA